METRIDRVKKQLHSSSYKLTPQREATVRVLLEHEEDHLSAEDVYLLVKEKSPEIGLATVYRTLELLTELKIVIKLTLEMEFPDMIFDRRCSTFSSSSCMYRMRYSG